MTKLEKILLEVKLEILKHDCPFDHKENDVDVDKKTLLKDDEGHPTGCRGITCEECWNTKVEGE